MAATAADALDVFGVDPETFDGDVRVTEYAIHSTRKGGSETVRLHRCPACGRDFPVNYGNNRAAHIGGHDPADFGLSDW